MKLHCWRVPDAEMGASEEGDASPPTHGIYLSTKARLPTVRSRLNGWDEILGICCTSFLSDLTTYRLLHLLFIHLHLSLSLSLSSVSEHPLFGMNEMDLSKHSQQQATGGNKGGGGGGGGGGQQERGRRGIRVTTTARANRHQSPYINRRSTGQSRFIPSLAPLDFGTADLWLAASNKPIQLVLRIDTDSGQ